MIFFNSLLPFHCRRVEWPACFREVLRGLKNNSKHNASAAENL